MWLFRKKEKTADKKEKKIDGVKEALKIAKSISGEHCLCALGDIAFELAKAGKFDGALEIAKSIRDEIQCLHIVTSIKDKFQYSLALNRIASELAKAGEIEEALKIAREGYYYMDA